MTLDPMALAAIREFSNDLRDMTIPEMKLELTRISEKVEQDTAWQEALVAAISLREEAGENY